VAGPAMRDASLAVLAILPPLMAMGTAGLLLLWASRNRRTRA
jgi:hypothetical protein